MQTCYHCGKLILGRKIMGQIGNNMHVFCSDKCRSSAWVRAGHKDGTSGSESSTGGTTAEASAQSSGKSERGVSTLLIDGAEYEYSAKTDGVTIKIAKLENKSSWVTGNLRLELVLSKSGPYTKGGSVTGVTIAVSSTYQPLRKHYSYTAMKTTARLKERPRPGVYQPILLVKEEGEDGRWHTAGYVNFPGTAKWS